MDGTLTATSSQHGDSVPPPSGSNPSNQPQDQGNQQGQESTTQRCKHCSKQVPKEGFSKHSKQCLRDKQERKRKKQEAQEAKDKGVVPPVSKHGKDPEGNKTNAGGVADDPLASSANTIPNGDAESLQLTASTTSTSNPTTSQTKKSATDKKSNPKKRKATDDPSTDAPKPPTKKQQKAAAKEAQAQADASTTNNKAKDPGNKTTNGKDGANTTKTKTTTAKPKGPVDVEKQCGVMTGNGVPCARSLTCKTHAMGAKRSVPGRSLPYDLLLQQYQKKNQAKQQKAVMAANQPLPEDLIAGGEGGGKVDSDEEREAVMAGIARANARPIWEPDRVGSAKDRHRTVRMKEVLGNSLGGNRGGNLFAVGSVGGGGRSAEQGAGQAGGSGKQAAGWNQSFSGEDGHAAGRRTSSGPSGARQASVGHSDTTRKGSVGAVGVTV